MKTDVPATKVPAESGRPAGVPSAGESPTLDRIYENGVFRAGYAFSEPFAYIDPNTDEIIGIGADLAAELADRLGVEVENIGAEWDGVVQGIPANKYDAIMTGLAFRPERDELVDYVLMGELGACVIARADDDRVTTFDDLRTNTDLRLGLTTGISFEDMVRSDYPEVTLLSLPNPTGGILWEDLLADRIDATINDALGLDMEIEMIAPGQLKIVPEDCMEHPLFGYQWGHGFPEGDTAFVNWVSATVDDLKDSGWYDDMWTSWMELFLSQGD